MRLGSAFDMITALAPTETTRDYRNAGIMLVLVCAAGAAILAELVLGPVSIPVSEMVALIIGGADPANEAILVQIRLPRVLTGIAVGVALALGGTAMQGVLRNPLADPGLIGITGGAALGAVAVLVLGDVLFAGVPDALRPFLLPMAAFCGAMGVTAFIFALSRRGGAMSVATLILAGVAVNAIAAAGIGAMVFISDDQQLRSLTFWSIGALGGANWTLVMVCCTVTFLAGLSLLQFSRALDLFQVGERAAFHSGLDVEAAKFKLAALTALAVGVVTAAAGPIGFIGLMSPHIARLILGPAHRWVLPGSALVGVTLVLMADLGVRMAVPPAEPPIGIATSLLGGPFFLWLLLTRMRGERLGA
ncbi:MAG: iron ABC transporter permease [Pseudomonadota bacterium]